MNNDYLNLDLELGATLSKSLVASVNHLCDRAEDAGANGVVLITLRCVPGAAREPVQVSLVNQWERALRRLERLPLLTLAAVDGVCNGLGLALLLATDYRVVTQRLRLSLALDGQEILPGMVLHRLATQIGAAHARRMARCRQRRAGGQRGALRGEPRRLPAERLAGTPQARAGGRGRQLRRQSGYLSGRLRPHAPRRRGAHGATAAGRLVRGRGDSGLS